MRVWQLHGSDAADLRFHWRRCSTKSNEAKGYDDDGDRRLEGGARVLARPFALHGRDHRQLLVREPIGLRVAQDRDREQSRRSHRPIGLLELAGKTSRGDDIAGAPGAVALVTAMWGMSTVPNSGLIIPATVPLRMQCAHGYSGCIGVLSIGCQVASRSVAGLLSISPLRIAVIGRQKL